MRLAFDIILVGVLLGIIIGYSSYAHGDDSLNIILGSHHECRECGYNEFNPGLGFQIGVYENGPHDISVGAGFYENSFSDRDKMRITETTEYIGIGYEYRAHEYVTVGADAIRAWGYEKYGVKYGAAPTFSIGTEALNVKTFIVPSTKSAGRYTVAGFMLRAGF